MSVSRIAAAIGLLLCSPAAANSLAIIHATAWTGAPGQPVRDATILIDGGRIVSVEPSAAPPAGAELIDAHGRAVTPGLVNAATQLGLSEVSSADFGHDSTSTADSLGPSFDVQYALNGNSTLVALARADGMTRAISYPSPSPVAPFDGLASLIRLRNGVDILDRPGVALFVTIGGGAWDKNAGSRSAQWQLLRSALEDARSPERHGGGHGGRDGPLPPAPHGNDATLRAVLAGTIPLAIITNRESDIRDAITLAADFRVRVVIVGGAEAWRAADALAQAHVPVVLDAQANLPGTFDQLGARQDNAAILARAGVTIAFGQAGGVIGMNYNAGLALREDAGLAVANGLPYDQALRAVTVNPLAIWAVPGGMLSPNADADLVIWDGDPLEVSSLADVVIIQGRAASTDNRQKALMRRYAPAAQR